MAGAIRLVSIERGHDPKIFSAMPFGGGGALHVGALIPRFPGVTSALGCIIADMRHDFVHTINRPLDDLDIAALDAEMAETAERDLTLLRRSGAALDRLDIVFELDMSYIGQTHTVPVPLPARLAGEKTDVSASMIRAAFEAAYRKTYGRLLEGVGVRLLSLRTTAVGIRPRFDLALLGPAPGATLAGARRGSRQVWWESGWHRTAVYDRLALPAGAEIRGPAVLEQDDATAFIDPGLAAAVDRLGNVIVRPAE